MAKKQNKISVSVDYAGKIPPQAIEIEEAVLGGLMLEKDAIDRVNLKPEYFYKDIHQAIFRAIQKLSSKKEPIDMLTVTEQLKKDDNLDMVGGPYYISVLTSKIASASHIETHALIITEKFIKRELIRISSEIQQKAFDDSEDTFDVFDSFYSQMDSINLDIESSDVIKSWGDLVKEALKAAEEREKLFKESKTIGIPTPVATLTKWTCGWQPKQLIIIAARPGHGKTAWALASIKTASKYGYKPALFSLEMSDVSIANRIIVGETGINADDFRSGNIGDAGWMQLNNHVGKIMDYNITIDDKPKSVNKIVAKVKSLHRKGLCNFVVVDYIQLSWDDSMKDNSIREQEVSSISRKLKVLAQELDIPVIALAQLNRSVETRQNKKPQLSDLRESGAIEQDADLVIFIMDPSKYGMTEDEEGNHLNGKSFCILEKQREGQVGTIPFRYNESKTAIYDWVDLTEVPEFHKPDFHLEPGVGFENESPF